MHIPNVFTSNRPLGAYPTLTMQYLQHSTHSAEKYRIWDGKEATFKGNVKLASLHCMQNSTVFRVMTWRREGQYLWQLRIPRCHECSLNGHHCNGGCCAIPLSELSAIKNPYVELALMTCKQDATHLADMKTCNGRECYVVEKVLPGSYAWFGVPDCKEDSSQLVVRKQQPSEEEFRKHWKLESRYGVHSFVIDIHKLLQAYQESIVCGHVSDEVRHHHDVTPHVVLRCGGTLLYKYEVCYVVIVTYQGDGIHDDREFPPINSPNSDEEKSPRCNWSSLLDDNGHYTGTKEGYPTFAPHHKKDVPPYYWDHVVFAIHLPEGKELSLPKDILVGGGPLETVHNTPDTWCHKFRRFGDQASEQCSKMEQDFKAGNSYQASLNRHAVP